MVIPSRGLKSYLLLVGGGLKVFGDTPKKHLENSSEDAQQSHPLVDQSMVKGNDPLDMLYSNP